MLEGDRCRGRKTKCDGIRPTCTTCASQRHDCHYVAEADATPIIAQKRRNEALQQQSSEQLDLLQSLASVAETDALFLLSRFREGDSVASINLLAARMRKIHTSHMPRESPIQSTSLYSPVASEIDPNDRRTLSPVSLGPPVNSRMVFEPRIDVVPAPPKLPPQW